MLPWWLLLLMVGVTAALFFAVGYIMGIRRGYVNEEQRIWAQRSQRIDHRQLPPRRGGAAVHNISEGEGP